MLRSSGANFLFVDKRDLVIPRSYTDSILPSITAALWQQFAKDLLGMKVVDVLSRFDELSQLLSAACAGHHLLWLSVGKVVAARKEVQCTTLVWKACWTGYV